MRPHDKPMRAIKIDPYERTVTEIEINVHDGSINKMIHPDSPPLSFIYNIPGHFLLLDDDGFLREPTPPMFVCAWYPTPLAGIGIILSNVPPEGDYGPATIKLDTIQKGVRFPGDAITFKGFQTSTGKSKSELFGGEVETYTVTPIFEVNKEGDPNREDEDNIHD